MKSAHLKLLLASLFFAILPLFVRHASAITVDQHGNVLVFRDNGQVLFKSSDADNDDDTDGGNGNSGTSGDGGQSGSSGRSGSSDSDDDDNSLTPSPGSRTAASPRPTATPEPENEEEEELEEELTAVGGRIVKREVKDGRIETEVILPNGVRVKTREEEGRQRTDIYQGGQKLRLERRAGRVVVKIENEEGEEVEVPGLEEKEVLKIEQRPGQVVRIQALENRFVVSTGQIGAQTDFPISVNLQTNELVVSTPAGEKLVAVLPDQAVQNMLAANVITQVRGVRFTQAVQEATEAASLQEVISLITTREGVLAYEIPGVKSERFLGFIKVDIPKTAIVSTQTGEVLQIQQSILSTALDLLSF